MDWSKWIRQTHRWVSLIFSVAVVANVVLNFVVPGAEELALTVGGLTLLPLFFLLISGLYLFALPYLPR